MSKGLEVLKDIKKNLNSIDDKYGFNVNFAIDEIKDDCKIITKELRALEIIIEKQVDIELFNRIVLFTRCKPFKEYNYAVGYSIANRDLTEDEFKLLKEVLKNESK